MFVDGEGLSCARVGPEQLGVLAYFTVDGLNGNVSNGDNGFCCDTHSGDDNGRGSLIRPDDASGREHRTRL